MTNGNSPNLELEARLYFYRSLYSKSLVGAWFYACSWLFVVVPYNYALEHSVDLTTMSFILLLLIIIGVGNFIGLRIVANQISRQHPVKDWPAYLGMLVSAGTWGALTVFTMPGKVLEPISAILAVITCGFGVAGAISLSASRRFAITFLVAIVGPGFVALAVQPSLTLKVASVGYLFYALGIWWLIKLQRKEFLTSLDATLALKTRSDELAMISTQDGLTGVKNRRYFEDRLAQELLNGSRTGSPLSLLMVDVDYFKQINDAYGHLAGDECLRRVAWLISSRFSRKTDIVARYGGEEFSVILPGTPLEAAAELAEKLRNAFEETEFQLPGYQQSLTVSIGLASSESEPNIGMSDLIRKADSALYRAKNKGRNRLEYHVLDTESEESLV